MASLHRKPPQAAAHSRIPVCGGVEHAMSWSSTPSANAGMNWLGYSSREELEASGILDKWAQQQQQHNSHLPPRRSVIQLCPRCLGHRIEKVVYNSMVLEQNCSECDGEGVIHPQTTGRHKVAFPTSATTACSQGA